MLLIVKAPPCSWLGHGRKALVADGATHDHDFEAPHEPGRQLHGRWCALRVGLERDACEFFVEGEMARGCRLWRDNERRTMWVDNDHDQRTVGTPINLWGCIEKPEWVKAYVFNSDGTLSPSPDPHGVCLGVERDGGDAKVVFVERSDARRRLVFGGGPEMESHFSELRAEAAVREAQRAELERGARALVTPAWCATLRDDGYAKLSGLVPLDLVRSARGEINRLLGQADGGTDAFKAKTMSGHPAIKALLRDSAVGAVLAELLGGDAEYYKGRFADGQIALRFPGDHCPPGASPRVSSGHFEGVRKHWHIDGCPNDFIPGTTDHYGVIHNFDVLVGVLLSDVEEPMSGELVLYPGSHTALASYFQCEPAELERLRTIGTAHLPTGDRTDSLFDRSVVHCTGRAGDVFLANYLTAHLNAPNVSPDIRYAVYFRLSGPLMEQSKANGNSLCSMVHPWVHWEGLRRQCGGDSGTAAAEAADAAPLREPIAEDESLDASMEALQSMFPTLGRETISDVLASCGGDAERATDHLLEMIAGS